MKAKVISVILLASLLLSGCSVNENRHHGKSKRDKKIQETIEVVTTSAAGQPSEPVDTVPAGNIYVSPSSDGILLYVSHSNCGEVCDDDDYWSSTNYKVYNDGTLEVSVNYNISGSYTQSFEVSDSELNQIAEFVYDGLSGAYSGYYVDACDGDTWHFATYDENGSAIYFYDGYTYGIDVFEDIQSVLRAYQNEIVVEPVDTNVNHTLYVHEYYYTEEGVIDEAEYEYSVGQYSQVVLDEGDYYNELTLRVEQSTPDQMLISLSQGMLYGNQGEYIWDLELVEGETIEFFTPSYDCGIHYEVYFE